MAVSKSAILACLSERWFVIENGLPDDPDGEKALQRLADLLAQLKSLLRDAVPDDEAWLESLSGIADGEAYGYVRAMARDVHNHPGGDGHWEWQHPGASPIKPNGHWRFISAGRV